jgi:hypothetical protein
MVTVGATASTVHVRVSVLLMLPAQSTAFTLNVCTDPSARGPNDWGDVQGENPPPSYSHRSVASGSVDEKVNVTFAGAHPDGPDVMVVTGAMVSTVHVTLDSPMLPALSVART